jgi:AcrR family transcriptional regulator
MDWLRYCERLMTPVVRSRSVTRTNLLNAARIRFQEHGFDGTTVREIAADAGVDAALIKRYFGSKEGLFTEITLADESLSDLLTGDRATVGFRMAETLTTKKTSPGMETVMRSLGNPTVAERYEVELHERFVVGLADWLGGRDARVRAGLMVGVLNGIAVSTTVLGQRSLREAKPSALTKHLGATLQSLIDG